MRNRFKASRARSRRWPSIASMVHGGARTSKRMPGRLSTLRFDAISRRSALNRMSPTHSHQLAGVKIPKILNNVMFVARSRVRPEDDKVRHTKIDCESSDNRCQLRGGNTYVIRKREQNCR